MAPTASQSLSRRNIAFSALVVAVVGAALLSRRRKVTTVAKPTEPGKQKKVAVDAHFLRQLRSILRIVIPGWRSKEFFMLLLHSFFLVLRTWLSVVVAEIDGTIVKHLVGGNKWEFVKGIASWFAIAVPATYTNSMIRFLQSKLSIAFRTRLTQHVHGLYLSREAYYRVINLDSRIENADQLVTTDVARFCDALSNLYSNLAKPLLDLVIFSFQLVSSVGGVAMTGLTAAYVTTALILRAGTPEFGKLAAEEAKLEGDFRYAHSRLITNAEEVAFYNGGEVESRIISARYRSLAKHTMRTLQSKIGYHMLEDFIVKYTWSAMGLLVAAVPVFFPHLGGKGRQKSAANSQRRSGAEDHTQAFITNKRLMISLADAGGRIMYSYKELAELAGFTSRVASMLEVFEDIGRGKYQRPPAAGAKYNLSNADGEVVLCSAFNPDGGRVSLLNVPVVTPAGEELVKPLKLVVGKGQHTMITGPNGCGKTSIMRIVAGLWPAFEGVLEKPLPGEIFYLPQRPYLSIGTLRDQIIYPHSHKQMLDAGRTEDDLMDILKAVNLAFIVEREGGWNARKEWKDVFSGGEKQRIGTARLFYHRPRYAVLDECTSAMSADIEGLIYQHAKDLGITLITISHRPSLYKYHSFLLRLEGGSEGRYDFARLNATEELMSVQEEITKLEATLAQASELKKRLMQVNKLLGM